MRTHWYGLSAVLVFSCVASAQQAEVQQGIARQFPGDVGIAEHPSVVFVEDFEADSLAEVVERWSWARGVEDGLLSLDQEVQRPPGSPGSNSLRMTVNRREGGSSGDLRKILDPGHEELYFRFYIRFAEDYPYYHHLTRMRGELEPTPWMMGGAGQVPQNHFSSAIEHWHGWGRYQPPGKWFFYTYWPEMTTRWGQHFEPEEAVLSPRGQWQCVEVMIRLNTAPDSSDGAQAFWIDGRLVGQWDPKVNPEFQGFNWRTLEDPEKFQALKINVIQLHHYLSEGNAWSISDRYAEQNPDFKINLEQATIWKDHIVVATEYIGPIVPE